MTDADDPAPVSRRRPGDLAAVGMESFPVRWYVAPLTAPGFVRFVNVAPDVDRPQHWCCVDCGARMPTAKQRRHALQHDKGADPFR